jgi:hypothetical protein
MITHQWIILLPHPLRKCSVTSYSLASYSPRQGINPIASKNTSHFVTFIYIFGSYQSLLQLLLLS